MSDDINPLAPAEDAAQEEAGSVEPEVVTSVAQIPAWAVMPDGGRTGEAAVEESPAEEAAESDAEEAVEAAEYDGARAHNQVDVRINQGT